MTTVDDRDDLPLFLQHVEALVTILARRYGWSEAETQERRAEGEAAVREWFYDPHNAEQVRALADGLRSVGEVSAGENLDAALVSGFFVPSDFGETNH